MESIGHYEILAEIARGGMGIVYRARDPQGRVFALKVLMDHDPDSIERFKREAQVAHELVHPNVIRVRAYGVTQGRPYLVMDYVEGEDLWARVGRDGPLPELEARRVFGALTEGLAAAHSLGIVHRDLKPQNVLLRGAEVYLTDFGLARRGPSTLTVTGELLGTPAYMAPEQALGERGAVGAAADIYGLGATLYAALSGSPPYRASTLLATLDQVVNASPAPLRSLRSQDLSPELEELVDDCLRKDPAERPSLDALRRRLGSSEERARRGPLVLLVAGLAALGTLVAASLVLASRPASSGPGQPSAPSAPAPTFPATPASTASVVPEIAVGPEAVAALVGRAEAALARLEFEEAAASAQEALALDAANCSARLAFVEAALEQGQWGEVSRQVPLLGPGATPAEIARGRYALGRVHLARAERAPPEEAPKHVKAAESLLRASCELRGTPEAWAWLGRLQRSWLRGERARDSLDRAERLDKRNPHVLLLRHDLAPSEDLVMSADSGASQTFEGLLLRAYYLARRGLPEEGDELRALRAKLRGWRIGEEAQIATALGRGFLARAQKEDDSEVLAQAQEWFGRARERAPARSVQRAKILRSGSTCLWSLERWVEAATWLRELVEFEPSREHRRRLVAACHWATRGLAAAWDTEGQRRWLGLARAQLKVLGTRDPQVLGRQLALEGSAAAFSCRFQEAEESLRRAKQILLTLGKAGRRPYANACYWQGRGRLLARLLGCPAEPATVAFDEALEAWPEHPRAQAFLAQAYMEEAPLQGRQLARKIEATGSEDAKALAGIVIAGAKTMPDALEAFLSVEPGNPRVLALGVALAPLRFGPRRERASPATRGHPIYSLTLTRVLRKSGAILPNALEASEALLSKALKRLPQSAGLRAERGMMRGLRGQVSAGRADLEQAYAQNPLPSIKKLLLEFERAHPRQE